MMVRVKKKRTLRPLKWHGLVGPGVGSQAQLSCPFGKQRLMSTAFIHPASAGDYQVRVGVKNSLVLPTDAVTGDASQKKGGVAGSSVVAGGSLDTSVYWSELSSQIVTVGGLPAKASCCVQRPEKYLPNSECWVTLH